MPSPYRTTIVVGTPAPASGGDVSGVSANCRCSRRVRGDSSLPVAKARDHFCRSLAVEIMLPAANVADGFSTGAR